MWLRALQGSLASPRSLGERPHKGAKMSTPATNAAFRGATPKHQRDPAIGADDTSHSIVWQGDSSFRHRRRMFHLAPLETSIEMGWCISATSGSTNTSVRADGAPAACAPSGWELPPGSARSVMPVPGTPA